MLHRIFLAASLLLAAAPIAAHAAPVATKTATISIIGRGITGITPTSCSFTAGPGSANQVVCKLAATTIPGNQAVTFAITGGTDAASFVLAADGTLSVGSTDLAAKDHYAVSATATAASGLTEAPKAKRQRR